MKKILVPTDFSGCSEHAVQTAAFMARKTGASLVLFHCLEIPREMDYSNKSIVDSEYEEAKENAELLLAQKYNLPETQTTEFIIRKGEVSNELAKYVDANLIDLVVMGSHGRKGSFNLFIGSNALKTIRRLHLPVFIVKEKFSGKIDDIVYASDFDEEERSVFKNFINMFRAFQPNIQLLYVKDSGLFDMPYIMAHKAMQAFVNIAAPLSCNIQILKDSRVAEGVISFAKDNKSDLIVMSNHFRKPIKRMLIGSKIEAIVNHSEVPVLSFDYPVTSEFFKEEAPISHKTEFSDIGT